jgi:hypothetical protein
MDETRRGAILSRFRERLQELRGIKWPIIITIFALALGAAFIFLVPNRLVHANDVPDPTERTKVRQTVRSTLLQSLVGALVLIGAGVSLRQLQLNREGQITERFTRAVDQLGSQDAGNRIVEVRIGGIYALGRIARDSPSDREAILRTLSAYVREHAVRPKEDRPQSAPLGDIAAAMRVLGMLPNRGSGLPPMNLLNVDLRGYGLRWLDLSWAMLAVSDLSRSHLSDCQLTRCWFMGASLVECRFQNSNLRSANLTEADLSRASLQGADLRDALLGSQDMVAAISKH